MIPITLTDLFAEYKENPLTDLELPQLATLNYVQGVHFRLRFILKGMNENFWLLKKESKDDLLDFTASFNRLVPITSNVLSLSVIVFPADPFTKPSLNTDGNMISSCEVALAKIEEICAYFEKHEVLKVDEIREALSTLWLNFIGSITRGDAEVLQKLLSAVYEYRQTSLI